MHKTIFLLALLAASQLLPAQSTRDWDNITGSYESIRQQKNISLPSLTSLIRSSSEDPEMRYALLFYWITHEIAYDVPLMMNPQPYKSPEDAVSRTFSTRKGICQGYVELALSVCRQLGITSFIIAGYTRHQGILNPLPHSWMAIQLGGQWYLSDPTWGAGYVDNMSFTALFNPSWYLVKPEAGIQQHIPFDPLFQFLSKPFSYEAFNSGDSLQVEAGNDFPSDSISQYLSSDRATQIDATVRRINGNGAQSELLQRHLSQILMEKKILEQNLVINQFNEAVTLFNQGVNQFNVYIQYKNKKFQPPRDDARLREMISQVKAPLNKANELMQRLQSDDPALSSNINQMRGKISQSIQKLGEEVQFVEAYIGTPVAQRKNLFGQAPVRHVKKR